MNSNLSYSPETLNKVNIGDFLPPVTLKFHIWPSKTIGHLFYVFASIMHHFAAIRWQWIYIWVTVRKRWNRVEIDDLLPPVTLKFYRRPWKTIGHLFYTHSSFTHHFIDIGGFRFELQSGNAQIGSNLIFCLPWPWNFTDDLEKNMANLRDLKTATGL